MHETELYMIYGTDYCYMTQELLRRVNLEEWIEKKVAEKREFAISGKEAVKDIRCPATRPKRSEIRIGIKPNLVAPVPPSEGATTHSEVVEGLILYLRACGYENLRILESSWVGDRTEDAFLMCGYEKLSEKYGVPLLDMKKAETVNVDCAGMTLTVCKPALEVDFLINVPVLKGHCQTRMTCALKNMKGLIPDSQKRAFHRMGLHRPIGHLSSGLRQDFILVDSICGDLSFEDGGNPIPQDRLIAAADPVLCDAWCCHLLNIPQREVSYIHEAALCGCGREDWQQAQVIQLNEPAHAVDVSQMGKALELSVRVEEVDSCSACYGNLIPVLNRLKEEGRLEALQESICIGQGYRGQSGAIGIGNCTGGFQKSLAGCPPRQEDIYRFLLSCLRTERES